MKQCNVRQSFAIIITTKDRRVDLTHTLRELIRLGLNDLAVYIYDDASESSVVDSALRKEFPNLEVRVNEQSKGLIVNRNRLAEWANEEILISLDDDSCFEDPPDLLEIYERFARDPTLVAVEFENRELNESFVKRAGDGTWLQMYTGFGHAIHRERFLRVGGYREFFVHMCEERDFAQRAWRLGYHIELCRSAKVLHRRSPVARLMDRNIYFLVRNTILFSVMNLASWRLVWLIFAPFVMVLFWPATAGRRKVALRAVLDGFKTAWSKRDEFTLLSWRQARAYARLSQRGRL